MWGDVATWAGWLISLVTFVWSLRPFRGGVSFLKGGGEGPAWGDVATWVGAVGTVGALVWAVILYRSSLVDQRRAQARLLSPIGPAVPMLRLDGSPMEKPCTAPGHLFKFVPGVGQVLVEDAFTVRIRLVSTSDEAFTDIRVRLVHVDGREIPFHWPFQEMAPGDEKAWLCYFPPDEVWIEMQIRVQFRDANGRWWERENGKPVRAITHSSWDED